MIWAYIYKHTIQSIISNSSSDSRGVNVSPTPPDWPLPPPPPVEQADLGECRTGSPSWLTSMSSSNWGQLAGLCFMISNKGCCSSWMSLFSVSVAHWSKSSSVLHRKHRLMDGSIWLMVRRQARSQWYDTSSISASNGGQTVLSSIGDDDNWPPSSLFPEKLNSSVLHSLNLSAYCFKSSAKLTAGCVVWGSR